MIDWVSCKLPVSRLEKSRLATGAVLMIDPAGEIETQFARRLPIEGSHDARMFVRGSGGCLDLSGRASHAGFLELSGNPSKFFQGHNLWGSDDLLNVLIASAERCCLLAEVEVSPSDRAAWLRGWIPLSRVDCTQMYELPSRSDVRAVLSAVGGRSRTRRGGSVVYGSTVYLQQGSRRWTLKLYSKGDEVCSKKKGHGLPDEIEHRAELLEYADRALRVELQLRALELVHRGLQLAGAWKGGTPMEQLAIALEGLQVCETFELPSDVLERLPGRLLGVYEAWHGGHDLRAYYSKATFYRWRRQLLDACGVDIAVMHEHEEVPANVLPFRRVIEVQAMSVPEWARDTPLYFDPPAFAKSVAG